MKTNNFDELPKVPELWVQVGDYKFKVFIKEGQWYECIQRIKSEEIFIEGEDDMESQYLSNAISALKIYSRLSKEIRIYFAGIEVSFGRGRGYVPNNYIAIQTSPEDDTGYIVDMVEVDRNKFIEMSDFFQHAAYLYILEYINNKLEEGK